MARMARAVFSGVPHHITQRGNRKQNVFFHREDYVLYKTLLSHFCNRFGVEIWAYCLMPNHTHLVVVPSDCAQLSRAIGEAHRRYTRAINFRNDWRGYLWQGRYASFPMDEFYLHACVKYVELNPVKANLVESPFHRPWSSAMAHLKRKNDDLVKVGPMLDRVEDWASYLDSSPYAQDEIIGIHSRTGRPLGNESFVETLENASGRRLRPGKPGRKPGKQGGCSLS